MDDETRQNIYAILDCIPVPPEDLTADEYAAQVIKWILGSTAFQMDNAERLQRLLVDAPRTEEGLWQALGEWIAMAALSE